jgi:hypothetical protein
MEATSEEEIARKIARDLMVGLVYPAVLGSILYSSIGVVADQARLGWATLLGRANVTFDATLAVRMVLLALTILFYACDFMYSFLTNRFKLRFFIYDTVFLAGLYVAVYGFGISPAGTANLNTIAVTISYAVFIVLYWAWDRHELKHAEPHEVSGFKSVIRWEKRSLAIFTATFLITVFTASRWPGWAALSVAIALSYVIYGFAQIIVAKAKVYRAYTAA